MKNAFRLCAVAAALAGAVGGASASTAFIFNPTGGGFGAGAVTATTFDQAPGNALAINGNTAAANCLKAGGYVDKIGVYSCPNATNVTTQFVYQANLAQFTNLGLPVFNQNDKGLNFTFTVSFTEIVTEISVLQVGPNDVPVRASAEFALAPTQTNNFFRMYYTGATGGNDLSGDNFAPGNPILEGLAVATTSSSSSDRRCAFPTAFPSVAPCSDLDNHAGDSWNSFDTVSNNGSTQVTFKITNANPGYFPDLPIGSLITLNVNTSQVVPFNQANPACAMIDAAGNEQGYALGTLNGAGTACTADTGKLGSINGLGDGPDFLFQADANSSLTFARVPEPGSLALFAGGLMAMGLWRRRQSAK